VSASKASLASGVPAPGGKCSFVARQPILTAEEKVFGYELLFRDGIENYFRETDTESASRRTLDTTCKSDLKCFVMAAAAS
jgi:EAL and modified HD-GYP domain-containing signal transduction protein